MQQTISGENASCHKLHHKSLFDRFGRNNRSFVGSTYEKLKNGYSLDDALGVASKMSDMLNDCGTEVSLTRTSIMKSRGELIDLMKSKKLETARSLL
eukprot:TRINITY_DN6982_c0_g1_i1.p1 TRINITY_DN6982_c0_g1~~TRINITY_DN6982_c0_g1_i1.p1  ORF type:complete len:97 (+),score=12.39 TRINITY_DN6982_c0_g1_i1:183-473(+)